MRTVSVRSTVLGQSALSEEVRVSPWLVVDGSATPGYVPIRGSDAACPPQRFLPRVGGPLDRRSPRCLVEARTSRHTQSRDTAAERSLMRPSGFKPQVALASSFVLALAALISPPDAPAAGTRPKPPSNLLSAAVSSTQVQLSWTDNSSNESGFKVERANSSAGPWLQVATVGAEIASYVDPGLEASTLDFYRVRAFNSVGDSSYSNVASSTTQPGITTHNVEFSYAD